MKINVKLNDNTDVTRIGLRLDPMNLQYNYLVYGPEFSGRFLEGNAVKISFRDSREIDSFISMLENAKKQLIAAGICGWERSEYDAD